MFFVLGRLEAVESITHVLGRLEAVESITQQHESAIQYTHQAINGLTGQIVGVHIHTATMIDEVQREQRGTATRIDDVQREQRDTATRIDEVQREQRDTATRMDEVQRDTAARVDDQSEGSKGRVTIDSPTVHTSMTHIYLSLVDSMIRRADQKCDLRSLLAQACSLPRTNVPIILIDKSFSYIHSFLGAILPLCRLAYTDLVSGETKLVYQKDELEREIGHLVVEIALKVGLISQIKARGRFHQQNVRVNFYHKSVQEFLAAVHLTCTDTDDIRSYCTSLDKVMNVANIIMFGIALDPSFCNDVSKHVKDTVDKDADIQQYRRTLDRSDRVEQLLHTQLQLYLTQCEWYRELTHSRTVTGDTSPPPSLHVTDIYLDHRSDSDTVRLTGDLLSANLCGIVSVSLGSVHHLLHEVTHYLPQCPHLTALCITNMSTF